ncbi:hypothetical protein NBRC116583_34500 [Arenicella sp. 4NH20-0111]
MSIDEVTHPDRIVIAVMNAIALICFVEQKIFIVSLSQGCSEIDRIVGLLREKPLGYAMFIEGKSVEIMREKNDSFFVLNNVVFLRGA